MACAKSAATKLRRHRGRSAGFTLLELLVVVTLISLAVGMVLLRFDGFGDAARLESTAAQLGSLLRLTATQAQTSGQPRLIEYRAGNDPLRIRRPIQSSGTWHWDSGAEFILTGRVSIEAVVVEGRKPDEGSKRETTAIRIRADGRFARHAVILTLHDVHAVVLLHDLNEPEFQLLNRRVQARTWDLLMLEMTHASDES